MTDSVLPTSSSSHGSSLNPTSFAYPRSSYACPPHPEAKLLSLSLGVIALPTPAPALNPLVRTALGAVEGARAEAGLSNLVRASGVVCALIFSLTEPSFGARKCEGEPDGNDCEFELSEVVRGGDRG